MNEIRDQREGRRIEPCPQDGERASGPRPMHGYPVPTVLRAIPTRKRVTRASLPAGAEWFFTGVVLLLSTNAFLHLLSTNDQPGLVMGAGAIFTQVIWSAVYLATGILLLRKSQGLAGIIFRDRLLVALVTMALVSVLWSDERLLTLRRSVALIGTTMFGAYFSSRFGLVDQLKILSRALAFAAIMSLLFVLVLPPVGIASGDFKGAWLGIYGHKNVLGSTMALGIIVFILRAISERRAVLRWWAVTGLALILLLGAQSVTGLLACLFTVAALVVSFAFRWRLRNAVAFFLGLAALAVSGGIYFISHAEKMLLSLGRSESLSGRSTIWLICLLRIKQRPWLGYGYDAFWRGAGSPAEAIWRLTGYPVSHAHNSVLNVWVDIGLIGVLVFLLQYFRSLWRAITLVRRTTTPEYLWPFVYLFFTGVYGLVESVILRQNDLTWILYTSVALVIPAMTAARAPQPPSAAAKRVVDA